ncbi:MAG: helix-turn-helix transcriptional regulator [Clostridium sp.]|nr:helix-turn-helix transcriptional regulator [Clostridium sp.]
MNRLSELRAEKNLKQEELAKIFSVDVGIISRYERNSLKKVDIEFENKVCDYFGCTLDYLRGRSNIRNEAQYSESLLRVSTMIKNFYSGDIKNKQMPSDEDIAHFEAFVLRFKELFQQLSSSRYHRQR